MEIKLTTLSEDTATGDYLAEHGLSILLGSITDTYGYRLEF